MTTTKTCRVCGYAPLSRDAEYCPKCQSQDPFGRKRNTRIGAAVVLVAFAIYAWHQGWFNPGTLVRAFLSK